MDTTWYDILRREVSTAIWLETSPDLHTAKSRIKKIASFWPGRYEVVDHQSQRIVAAVATPLGLRAPLKYIGECVRKSFWISYDWLLAPAPVRSRAGGLYAVAEIRPRLLSDEL